MRTTTRDKRRTSVNVRFLTGRTWLGWGAAWFALVLVGSATATAQIPLGTSFTYQGQLKASDAPAEGRFDFEFNVYDDYDPLVGNVLGTVTLFDIPVSNGLFTVELDFGSDVFTGEARWLEIAVRPAGSGPLSYLYPLQRLSPTPFALYARSAAAAPGMVPIGSIVAWHKDLFGTSALPDGWVECNGQTLSDPDSPFVGQTIPDLNGEGRFLRGGTSSGVDQVDEFKAHAHSAGSYSAAGSEHQHRYTSKCFDDFTCDGHALTNLLNYGSALSLSGWHGHSIIGTSASTGSTETRPVNMSVVWIMRVK